MKVQTKLTDFVVQRRRNRLKLESKFLAVLPTKSTTGPVSSTMPEAVE